MISKCLTTVTGKNGKIIVNTITIITLKPQSQSYEESMKQVPTHLEEHLENPYAGLFGSSVIASVVEEIVSDPTMDYRPSCLEELIGASAPSIRDALSTLVHLGLLEKIQPSGRHPVYRVNVRSKKFIALSFLSYAILDDREGTDCMDLAVYDYYCRVLRESFEPLATASTMKLEFTGRDGVATGTAFKMPRSAVSW